MFSFGREATVIPVGSTLTVVTNLLRNVDGFRLVLGIGHVSGPQWAGAAYDGLAGAFVKLAT